MLISLNEIKKYVPILVGFSVLFFICSCVPRLVDIEDVIDWAP